MDGMQPLEALINRAARLAVVETGEPDGVLDWLRKQFSATGRASYVWTAQQGLQRVAVEHIVIPGTRRPLDVLDYILASQHFGIYVLRDFQVGIADPKVCARLEQQISDDGSARKLVILLGARYQLPTRLATRVEQITFA